MLVDNLKKKANYKYSRSVF